MWDNIELFCLLIKVYSVTYWMNGIFTRNMILLQKIKMGYRHSTYLAKCKRYKTFCWFKKKFWWGFFFSLAPSDRIDLPEAQTTRRHDRAFFLTYESLPVACTARCRVACTRLKTLAVVWQTNSYINGRFGMNSVSTESLADIKWSTFLWSLCDEARNEVVGASWYLQTVLLFLIASFPASFFFIDVLKVPLPSFFFFPSV